MRVFKFGGASLKSAIAIKNMVSIVCNNKNDHPLIVVVSAMGKTTNALELILQNALNGKEYMQEVESLKEYHINTASELENNNSSKITNIINDLFQSFEIKLKELKSQYNGSIESYQFSYDQIVSYGELLSSKIVSEYMNITGTENEWFDARTVISTDSTYTEGKINWKRTTSLIKELNNDSGNIKITQGFIGSDPYNNTTTLGREGSDFTGAIFANCLNAESLTIWKDVPGILNADPKKFHDAQLYKYLSYREAAEMTYYGASVIHPKTIKPLANKNIPLHVRSFESPAKEGTVIANEKSHEVFPAYITKDNQAIISFKVKDFSFIDEKNISTIFHVISTLNIKINLMQNSATSFSICIDYKEYQVTRLIEELKKEFKILFNHGLQLITVKNYTEKSIERFKDEKVLLEQRSRNNYRIVVKETKTF
ncbi:aspartate kinase [Marinigracilibium pacificum]|uniref:Aspartokinase n=1 Tax=Marinigracilibium pacificum TaxID=2729599 RepID=A0A848J2B5_9BACT|nr:aspartate kinase [Marinigracilibium pacificum]NMM48624.1 aspartate kinase [Marinigracilibium pacificum]